jgi:hypothetical protein
VFLSSRLFVAIYTGKITAPQEEAFSTSSILFVGHFVAHFVEHFVEKRSI